MSTKHLDIGCGYSPRDPYASDELYGVDIHNGQGSFSNFCIYSQQDIIASKLTFQDSFFDSISAFDVLEHVPRVSMHNELGTINPFVNLMNEVHRLLKNGGRFFAVTPCYPHKELFSDPTHVNFITDETHHYFVGDDCYSRNYGFEGMFSIIKVRKVSTKLAKKGSRMTKMDEIYDLKRKLFGKQTHILWELQAHK